MKIIKIIVKLVIHLIKKYARFAKIITPLMLIINMLVFPMIVFLIKIIVQFAIKIKNKIAKPVHLALF